jgi:hypothetical protein
MEEYNQPRAHFSPRKVKKLKSREYDIPLSNTEPLPTPSGRRRARPYLGRRRARFPGAQAWSPPPHGGAGVRAPSLPCAPSVHLYIRGICPSYPDFTTLGFVSWDSFVGSLHEVAGMVFQSLIQLMLDFFP